LKKLFETKHLPTLVDILEGDRLNPDNIYALKFSAWYNKAAAGVVTALIKNASMPAKYRDVRIVEGRCASHGLGGPG
jgi:hypothetical protein